MADGKLVELAIGFGTADGVMRYAKERIRVSDWRAGRIFVMNSDSEKSKLLIWAFKDPADIFFDSKAAD